MYGAILGTLVGLVLAWTEVASWWWVLWSAIVGGLLELCARLGAGEEFGEAIGNCITAGIELSNTTGGNYSVGDGYPSAGGGGGDFGGGGDCGGGDCGGGGGGCD